MKALLSVSDKTGIVEFAQALHTLGIGLLSTGATARLLSSQGLPVTDVAELTQFPEMLDGRVKTLHPKVHAGLLACRDRPGHMAQLQAHGIATIDLLVVNLYPFADTVARADCTLAEAIENIDIGGPAMVRSAAKNWQHVGVLTDAAQYPAVLAELTADGKLSDQLRFALSVAAFNRIAQYDAAISDYLSSLRFGQGLDDRQVPARMQFPGQSNAIFTKVQDLRYGENAHQQAALYRELHPAPGALVTAEQLQGKELSYNNLADADAAWECVKSFDTVACVIVKHANPCGVALGQDAADAYGRALQTDPTSAFGGIIAFNCPVDGAAARQLCQQFVEVLLAPEFSAQALEIFKAKAQLRLLRIALPAQGGNASGGCGRNALDARRIGSGLLLQTADNQELSPGEIKVVTHRQPDPRALRDLLFAWKVAKYVKSNAIVFCKDGMTMGVGAGQMSRLDSARIASIKAQQAGLTLQGTAVASDAFFPFRDGLDVVLDAGASYVIQPGGSVRDQEVIDAANERGAAMVFTGLRHFRH